jgi:hypothetical protein
LNKRFIAVVSVLCLGYLALELVNGRAQMSDFRVYYDAANALLNGEQVYGKAFGLSSGFYKYSPFACLIFIPLAVLPYAAASIIYYLLITGGIIFFSLRVSNYLDQANTSAYRFALPVLTGFFLIDHLERELHLGNINLFLLIALFECYILLKSKKDWMGGIWFGLVLLFKPHFLLLLPYLLWKKRIQALATAILTIAIGLLTPAIGIGWLGNAELLHSWFTAMSDHNLSLQTSPNTIYGLINNSLLQGQAGSWLVLIILAVISCFVAFRIIQRNKESGSFWSNQIHFSEYFLLVGLVPNLVHTDTEHFMWVWPMLALAIQSALINKTKNRILIIALLGIAFVPFAINTPDIVGSHVQDVFDNGGLGIANLLILACALIADSKLNRNQHAEIRFS